VRRKFASAALVPVLFAAAACGGGGKNGQGQVRGSTAGTAPRSLVSEAKLEAAGRAALRANYRLSIYVLWHNQLPGWAEQSTRGPALLALQAAAAKRSAGGIRVRMLSDDRTIVSFVLDPSYAKATAIVVDRQRVQPSSRDGHASGRSIRLNERARYELRRLGQSARFVVWKVAPTR
jgi:hypothetical protein